MTQHLIAPNERTLQLNVPLVLPGVENEQDGCLTRLETRLEGQTGIRDAHFDRDQAGRMVLCLHYDPNLLTLEKLERLARDEGAQIVARFKHETLVVKGMDCASCAASIEHIIKRIPGVLSVTVNYAVEKLKVEYDSTLTGRDTIAGAVKKDAGAARRHRSPPPRLG